MSSSSSTALPFSCVSAASAADPVGEPGRAADKPNPLKNVYFGEQHLHTVNSPDAFAMGTRNTPDDAYNFAKGKAIKKNTTGEMVQKKTPYDWCAVTDHAEYMGVLPNMANPQHPYAQLELARKVLSRDVAEATAANATAVANSAMKYTRNRMPEYSTW